MTDILKVKVNNQWQSIPAIKGDNGEGVPTGGTTGQVLKKKTNTDYDTEWDTIAIPTKTSDLTNDSGFITDSYHDSTKANASDVYTKTEDNALLDTKLNKNQITNCILEDPQNIKLELNNGTLTLKAGSVVCVPNGFESDGVTPKFDEVSISADINMGTWGSVSSNGMIMRNAVNGIIPEFFANIYSGTTAPPTGAQYMWWYDTTNNLMKNTSDSGTTWTSGNSFPFCIITTVNGSVTSIDQTFQSIGYIGSTVFVRKGLKVLIPNGRNADGSLKNIERTTSKVFTRTQAGTTDFVFGVNDNAFGIDAVHYYTQETKPAKQYCAWYKPSENIVRWTNDNSILYGAIVCSAHRTDGKIDYFQPYTATNILKYSDKSQISGWGMPSSRYVDLTLGASGITYTAPANGWVALSMGSMAPDNYLAMHNVSIPMIQEYKTNTAFRATPIISVLKGNVFQVFYSYYGTLDFFRFYYAEGEQ